jgi:hypothetical protein
MRLFILFLAAILIASVFHVISMPVIAALAHEGISAYPTPQEIAATFPIVTALNAVLLALVFGMALIRRKSGEQFSYLITPFYAVAFTLIFVMISLSGWRGTFDSIQIFHFIHGFHSIFTLGSVITLDFLFVLSSRSGLLKQHVYSLFPTISKVIWIGLSLDFISVFLITDHFVVTEKFLFAQTVIGILIVNGVLLSGPIARKLISAVMERGGTVEARWRVTGNIAGAVSITSWLTITALDFFKNLTLGYGSLALLYLCAFSAALLGHLFIEYLLEKNIVRNRKLLPS